MSEKPQNLEAYRDMITSVFRQNMLSVLHDSRFPPNTRVGTALLCAASVIGSTSAAWVAANPHLANAPHDAVIRDLMGFLTESLCEQKPPRLSVVGEAKP